MAIVTGNGGGIGQAIAMRFAREGAKVVVVDMVQDTAKSTAESIKAKGGQALAVMIDATKREDTQRMVRETLERFGSIDILVNNVGWFGKASRSSRPTRRSGIELSVSI